MALMSEISQDARYTIRQLRRAPFFTLTVIVTLALSIGATAALVGVLRATLLNALPYAHPEELVQLADFGLKESTQSGMTAVLRAGDLAQSAAADGKPLFRSTGFFYADDSALGLDGHEPLQVPAVGVSGGFFDTLGTPAALGRTLRPADDVVNGPQLLVISDHLWRSTFAADPGVIGRSVRLGAQQATVVGVMPKQFDLPASVDLWHPGHVFASNFGGYRGDGTRFVTVVGRLAEGRNLPETARQLDALSERLAHAYPLTDGSWRFSMVSLRTSLFGEYRHALLLLSLAVGLVLVLAAVNIAGLQLSRNAARATEFAVRGALGITRGRLVRQLLTESLLLVLTGSALGVAVAYGLLRVLATRLPAALLRVETPHLDLTVLVVAILAALVVGLGTAAVPAMQASAAVGGFSQRLADKRTRRLGPVFTTLQITLSLVLLTVSASLLENLYGLLKTPLGFDPRQVQTFSVDLPWGVDPAKAHRLYSQLEERFRAMPGVTAAGYSNAIPLGTTYTFRNTFDVVGRAVTPRHDTVIAEGRNLSPGYLETMRVPLLAGRNFSAQDADANRPPVVMINRTLAQRYFGSSDPVGQRLRGAAGAKGEPWEPEIVGVTGDVQGTQGTLGVPVQPEVYFPDNSGWPHMHFALRTEEPLVALQPQVTRLVAALDSTASAGHFAPAELGLTRSLLQPRLNAALLTAFAGLSLLLVVIGVYGLVAFDVSQRTRELGLRLALGSTRRAVLGLVLGRSMRFLAAGLGLGLVGSVLAGRVVSSLLVQGTGVPVIGVVGVVVLLGAAVLGATFVPARAAANLDPMVALKVE